MKWTLFGARCAAALIAFVSVVHADGALSPGKTVAYRTISNAPITTGDTSLTQVTLAKGKRKRVVEVDVSLIDKSNTATSLRAYVTINGFEVHPTQFVGVQTNDNCGGTHPNCTLSAIYWVDLDLLETSFPGVYVGQPLAIDVVGRVTPVAGIATVSVRARLVKK